MIIHEFVRHNLNNYLTRLDEYISDTNVIKQFHGHKAGMVSSFNLMHFKEALTDFELKIRKDQHEKSCKAQINLDLYHNTKGQLEAIYRSGKCILADFNDTITE